MAVPNSEDRDDTRFDHISTLQVKDLSSGKICEARMQNYSNGGIYFESDGIFQKGAKIYICMQNSPYTQTSGLLEYCNGKVIWRKKLKRSSFDYGYGVQLVSSLTKQDLHSKMVKPYPEYRVDNRFNHNSPLQVKDLSSGKICEARMQNYSNGGIYFESDGIFQKGAKICFCMQNSPYFDIAVVVDNAEVVWRKELEGSLFNYGYGIHLITDSSNDDLVLNHANEKKEARKQPRKPFFRTVQFRTPKGKTEGRTKNISTTGVFIATEEKLEVGQSIKLSLPLKGKTAKILGQIVWLNEDGFGLKFKKIK
jgi:Tfp pilus assembly protein PilZ